LWPVDPGGEPLASSKPSPWRLPGKTSPENRYAKKLQLSPSIAMDAGIFPGIACGKTPE
jgi:hypothetical protein